MCINGSSLVGTFSGGHESISNDQTGIRARLAPLRCTKSERRGEFLPGQECGYRWGQFLVCWSRRPTVSPHPRTTSITSNSSFITFHHITLSSSPPPSPPSITTIWIRPTLLQPCSPRHACARKRIQFTSHIINGIIFKPLTPTINVSLH